MNSAFNKFSSGKICEPNFLPPANRDSGNDFGRYSVPFLDCRISDIRAACNYPTRYANFKSWISDIPLKSVSFISC